MKIWLSKNSEVSVREQIIAQISLGILSRDLEAGEKLPSTREIARRFQIHQNTVSSAYRELAEQGLVKFKRGSGVYVRENANIPTDASTLDQIITRFFQEAAAHGFSLNQLKARLQSRLEAKPPTHFLVVESNLELRKILTEEIRAATSRQIDGISLENFGNDYADNDAQIVAMSSEAEKLQKILPPHKSCIFLKANSVPDSMAGKARPSSDDLIAAASGWEKFLELAKMFLLAARIEPETLILRSTNEPDWKNGLQTVSLIICDSATAKEFPDDERVRIFRLIADSSLHELRKSIG
jgi:GntR family transcriptional regulator